MKIGFIIRGLTYFKALAPIINELKNNHNLQPIIFYYCGETTKIYDVAQLHLFPKQLSKVKSISFKNDKQLIKKIEKEKIKWLVGIILPTKESSILDDLKRLNVKTCSIPNFTDGFWTNRVNANDIKKVNIMGYMSNYAIDFHRKYLKGFSDKNCLVVGQPMLDAAKNKATKPYVLIMLPNIRKEHYKSCFGGIKNFNCIINNVAKEAKNRNLLLVAKSRKKQWHPKEINSLFDKIVYDKTYYPSTTFNLMSKSERVICFNSSSVFESLACKRFCINIHMNLNYSIGSKSRGFKSYYKEKIYNHPGVVKTIIGNNELIGVFNEGFEAKLAKKYEKKYCKLGNASKDIIEEIVKR